MVCLTFSSARRGVKRQTGSVYVYNGATRALICEIEGQAQYGKFGIAIDGGYDVDGDGMPNIVVGAPGVPNALQAIPLFTGGDWDSSQGDSPSTPEYIHSYGRAYVFSASSLINHGSSDPLPASSAGLILVPSVAGDTEYGIQVEIGNDVTQDTLSNIIVNANFESETGMLFEGDPATDQSVRTYVYSGVDGSEIVSYTGGDLEDHWDDFVEWLEAAHCCDFDPTCCITPWTCEDGYGMCADPVKLCSCLKNVHATYNRKLRNLRRISKGMKVACLAACGISAVAMTPAGGAVVCFTCIFGLGGLDIGLYADIRNTYEDNWSNCFLQHGGPQCAVPGTPWQPWP